jgi:hypothetical protein
MNERLTSLVRGAGVLITACVAVSLTTPMVSASPSRTVFFDDFDRADGPIGWPWGTIAGAPSGPRLTIAEHRACGDVQTVGMYDTLLTGTHTRVSYSFAATDPSGFESYVITGTTCSNNPTVCAQDADCGAGGTCQPAYMVGCSGGWNGAGACLPRISYVGGGGTVLGRTGTPIPMKVNTSYRVEAEFNDGLISVTIADAEGQVLGGLALSTSQRFAHFGLLVGRSADSHLTCADDFRIEDLSQTATSPGEE